MNINIKRIIIVGLFLIFNYVLPTILFKNGIESQWLFVVFKLLSIIAIPIFMFHAYDTSKMVKLLAILLLLVEITYLLTGLSVSYEINILILMMGIIIFYFSMVFVAFTAYVLKTEHFFSWKSILPLLVLTFLLWARRFVEVLCIYKNVGYDLGYYKRIGTYNDLSNVIQSREIVFLIYAIFTFIVLEVISYQNSKINVD